MQSQPERYGAPWTRNELILAFDLYCRIPFKATKASNPEVQMLARMLNRSAAGVARKLGNFGAFDPVLREQDITGLPHGSKLDRQVWDEFHRDWGRLVTVAHRLREKLEKRMRIERQDEPFQSPIGPSERVATARQRLHQSFFRQAVLSSYDRSCCVTGIPVEQALVAAHIVPWSVDARLRADPTNGLCLSATFDRLFDSGLMSVNDDLTIRFSSRILKHRSDQVRSLICRYHDRAIRRPVRFLPDVTCLQWHRANVFFS